MLATLCARFRLLSLASCGEIRRRSFVVGVSGTPTASEMSEHLESLKNDVRRADAQKRRSSCRCNVAQSSGAQCARADRKSDGRGRSKCRAGGNGVERHPQMPPPFRDHGTDIHRHRPRHRSCEKRRGCRDRRAAGEDRPATGQPRLADCRTAVPLMVAYRPRPRQRCVWIAKSRFRLSPSRLISCIIPERRVSCFAICF